MLPVVITKFELGAKELKSMRWRKMEILIYAIAEHNENAGVRGDATIVLPPTKALLGNREGVRQITKKIARNSIWGLSYSIFGREQ